MTSSNRIKTRLRTEGALRPWRRKIYDLRSMVAGDYSSVDEKSNPQKDTGASERDSNTWKENQGMANVLVTEFEDGTSNKMLQALRTLVQQSAFHFPEIEFEDIDPLEAAVNSLYLKKRLGAKPYGCEALPHMRRALWHYIIDGIGWVWTGVREGKPSISCVDTVNVTWDTSVGVEPTDARWVAVRWSDSLAYWIQIYGRGPFKELLGNTPEERESALEKSVELIFYYDIDGPKGTHEVYILGSEGIEGNPIERVNNPHTMDCDGIETPFLPLVPCFYLALPSLTMPVGIAELLLPAQLALRGTDRYSSQVVERGAPWLEYEDGAYDQEEADKLAQGEIGEMIKRKKNTTGAEVKQGAEIPATVLERAAKAEKEIYASSGADPYASGSKVENTKFAAEVTAIQGSASLVAGWIAMDHADFWRRVVRNVLANAKKFDMMPLRLTLDGDELDFGAENPIGDYLRGDADAVVAEGSTAFAPKEKRIQDAAAMLRDAAALKLDFPNLYRMAVERWLRAQGVRNVAQAMEMPPTPAAPPGATGAAQEGGLDPAAVAAANTGA